MAENTPTPDGERRAWLARTSLILTLGMTSINIIGASVFWISLPERMRGITAQVTDHESRMRALETGHAKTAETLARIDERTEGIKEGVTNINRRLDKATGP